MFGASTTFIEPIRIGCRIDAQHYVGLLLLWSRLPNIKLDFFYLGLRVQLPKEPQNTHNPDTQNHCTGEQTI